jgi:hypothetical protein
VEQLLTANRVNDTTTTYHENILQEYVEEERYPELLERVKAIVIDNVLVLVSLFLVSAIISAFGLLFILHQLILFAKYLPLAYQLLD